MLLVGLTGGIGSGKSTVAWLLAARGAIVIDADEIARQVVEPGRPAWHKIVEHFGSGVLLDDSTIDRKALAAAAFGDSHKLTLLNEITHPPIMDEIAGHIETYRGTDCVVVLDAPLLVEAGGAALVDVMIVVATSEETALKRVVEQRGMDEEDVRKRMAAQASPEEKAAMADWLITNEGSVDDLESQVEGLWRILEARAAGRQPPAGGGAAKVL